jgi:hypothetical protein
MAQNALKNYRLYSGVTEAWELVKTGLVVISDTRYRLEVWHSHSNPDIAYFVSVFVMEGGVWKRMPDAPFPEAPDPEMALSTAIALLSERAAA